MLAEFGSSSRGHRWFPITIACCLERWQKQNHWKTVSYCKRSLHHVATSAKEEVRKVRCRMDHPPPPPPANAEAAAADAGLKESSVNVVRETAPVRWIDQHWSSITACQSADENQSVTIKCLTPIVVSNVWRCMEKHLKVLVNKRQGTSYICWNLPI